jgi:hypothetical protein
MESDYQAHSCLPNKRIKDLGFEITSSGNEDASEATVSHSPSQPKIDQIHLAPNSREI